MKGLKTFLAVIICILLVIMQFGTHVLFGLGKALTRDNVASAYKKIDVKEIISSDNGIDNEIYADIKKSYAKMGFSDEDINKIINTPSVKKILGETIGSVTDYIVTGNKNNMITSDELYKLFEDNLDGMLTEAGLNYTDDQKRVILKEAKDNSQQLVDEINENINDIDQDVVIVQNMLSFKVRIIILLITIGLMALLFVCLNRDSALRTNGTITLVVGLFVILFGVILSNIVKTSLFAEVFADSNNLDYLIGLFTALGKPFITNGIIASIIGLFLLICPLFFSKKVKE